MTFLRTGDWRPGAVSPALLAIQLITTLQAALRGLDYWSSPGGPPSALSVVEGAAPPQVWGGLLCGSTLVVLLGLAGRWPGVLVLGHLMLAAVYLGVGIPVLSASAVGPLGTSLVAIALGALAVWTLITDRRADIGLAARLMAVVLLAGVACLIGRVLGVDYRTGTGLAGAGGLHAALAVGVIVGTFRRRAAAEVEREQEVALC